MLIETSIVDRIKNNLEMKQKRLVGFWPILIPIISLVVQLLIKWWISRKISTPADIKKEVDSLPWWKRWRYQRYLNKTIKATALNKDYEEISESDKYEILLATFEEFRKAPDNEIDELIKRADFDPL